MGLWIYEFYSARSACLCRRRTGRLNFLKNQGKRGGLHSSGSRRGNQTFLPTFSFHTFLFLFVSFDTTPLPPFDKGDFSLQRKVWKKSVPKRKENYFTFFFSFVQSFLFPYCFF
jgi:hypothetical protein